MASPNTPDRSSESLQDCQKRKSWGEQAALALFLCLMLILAGGTYAVWKEKQSLAEAEKQLESYQRLLTAQEMKYEELSGEQARLAEQRQHLLQQVYESQLGGDMALKDQLQAYQLDQIMAQQTKVQGAGVRLTLADATGVDPSRLQAGDIIHERDVQFAVNLLKIAGAKAIAVNGERLLATSKLICNGPTILVNRSPKSTPFVIEAIGDSAQMLAALNEDWRLQRLKQEGKVVRYEAIDLLTIAPFADAPYLQAQITLLQRSKLENDER